MNDTLARAAVLLSALQAAGCSAPPPPRTTPSIAPAPERPAIAQPCPLVRASGPPASPPRVFVELARVEGDLLAAAGPPRPGRTDADAGPQSPYLTRLFDDPRLSVLQVSGVLATSDAPATLAWDVARTNGKTGCPETDRWDLTVTVHTQPEQPNDVELELTLVPAPPPGTPEGSWYVPEHRRVHTTVQVKDQQPIIFGGFARHRPRSEQSVLVVTPYVIRSDADLRALFECKVERTGRTRARTPDRRP